VQHEERKELKKRADSRRASGPPRQMHLAIWRFPVVTARKMVLLRPELELTALSDAIWQPKNCSLESHKCSKT
jgi:hypothetical protein